MILSPNQIHDAEKRAFASGVSPEKLMEEAGTQMAGAIHQFLPSPGRCFAFFGKGHNGGDALVCARLLSQSGWNVTLIPAFNRPQWASLTRKKWDQAGLCDTQEDPAAIELSSWAGRGPLLVLDGLLGIGAAHPLREPVTGWCRLINRWRTLRGARVAALDIPTGVDAQTGTSDPDAVRADWTLSVAFAKPGLLCDGAEEFVGRLALMRLPALEAFAPSVNADCPRIASPDELTRHLPRRTSRLHKGACGKVVLVAGNTGTVGAACLSARGALRAGAGLVTLCVPENILPIAASRAPEECMVVSLSSPDTILALSPDSLGLGPGLGQASGTIDHILTLNRLYQGPAVLDADALNALAKEPSALTGSAGPRLLTPHQGEMRRLFPEAERISRFETVERFTKRHPVTLLLKGARTLVGERGRVHSVNPTGSPGMASGGMGDVLTGVCAAFLGMGIPPLSAGKLAAWLCGRSAEILISEGTQNEESLLASDVAENLGAAFESLRRGAY